MISGGESPEKATGGAPREGSVPRPGSERTHRPPDAPGSAHGIAVRAGIVVPMVIMLGAVLRALVAGLTNPVTGNGAVWYLPLVPPLASFDWEGGLTPRIPPLFSGLCAVFYRLTGDLELSGQIVAVLSGSTVPLAVFLLGRRLLNERIGLLAALLATFAPFLVIYSAWIESEITYTAFHTFALVALLAFIEKGSLKGAILFGILASLATLTRPEGLGILAIGLLGALVWDGRRTTPKALGRRTAAGLLALSAFAVVAFPYARFMHEKIGRWAITGKAGLHLEIGAGHGDRLFRLTPDHREIVFMAFFKPEYYRERSLSSIIAEDPSGFAGRYINHLKKFADKTLQAVGHAAIPFVIIAWVYRPRLRRRRFELVLAALVALQIAAFSCFYADRRLLVGLVPVFILWAAVGLEELAEAARRTTWLRGRLRSAAFRRGLIALVCALFLPRIGLHLAEHGMEWRSSFEERIGKGLSPMVKPGEKIMEELNSTVWFYTGGSFAMIPSGEPDEILDYMAKNGIRWIIVDDPETSRKHPDLLRLLRERPDSFEVVRVEEDPRRGRRVTVYRRRETG